MSVAGVVAVAAGGAENVCCWDGSVGWPLSVAGPSSGVVPSTGGIAAGSTGGVVAGLTTTVVSCGARSGSATVPGAGAAITGTGVGANVWSATVDATGTATVVAAAATTPATMPAFVDIGPLSSTAMRVNVGACSREGRDRRRRGDGIGPAARQRRLGGALALAQRGDEKRRERVGRTDEASERCTTAVHASPGVLLGDAGDVRDLVERQLLDVAELERLAVGVGERRQSTRHLSVRERTIEVDDLVRGRHRRIDESSHAVEGARLAAPAVALVEADVRQDAVEPSSQVELAVEPGHRGVGPEERLLDGIFGGPRLAEAHHRVGIERR